ncbi:helix-turn-helix domain-containing protein [Flavitalea flava]
MERTQDLEEFYRHKLHGAEDNLNTETGHFNVCTLHEFPGSAATHLSSGKRNYYEIILISGHSRFYFADRSIELKNGGLLFSNPQIPYIWESLSWESANEEQSGFLCFFTETFFHRFGQLNQYPFFKPGGTAAFNLSEEQFTEMCKLFQRMIAENVSDYIYKNEVLNNKVFELMQTAVTCKPAESSKYNSADAALRATTLFAELLERQFPIESPLQRIKLRTQEDFVRQLSVQIYYLNRVLKESTGKTTVRLIADRITQEARELLLHTDWDLSQIGLCLGFGEVTEFITFFRKNALLTPGYFRKTHPA